MAGCNISYWNPSKYLSGGFVFLYTLLLLCLMPQQAKALEGGSGASGKAYAHGKILQGIELLYEAQYREADRIFKKVITQFPDGPGGYFYSAMVAWSRLSAGFWAPTDVEEFRHRIDKAITVSKKRIARQEEDAQAYFYLGGALGFKGRFKLMQRKWIASFFLALDAIEALRTCKKLDPHNRDVLLGLGTFDYYTSRLSGVIKFLSYLLITRGDKEEGLRKLHVAAAEGTYSALESKSTLLHIYLFMEDDHRKALPLAREMAERFKRNSRYKYLEGATYVMLNMELEYRKVVEYLRNKGERLSSKSLSSIWINQADYLEACHDLFQFSCSEARIKLRHVLDRSDPLSDPAMVAWPLLKIGMSYDLEGNRERALEYYSRIRGMENGSGAQFLAEKFIEVPVTIGDNFLAY